MFISFAGADGNYPKYDSGQIPDFIYQPDDKCFHTINFI